ncbi:MAG: CvpA family protein [Proteobacteria bacterium]|nr:CvpA family protein [Pseudomonadota bacterium]
MDFLNLNWVDYAIIAFIVFSILISLVRGFVREAISLTSWVLAFWVGFTFSTQMSGMLTAYIENDTVRIAVAFFILFAVTLIIGALVNFLFFQLVEKTGLTGTDRMLGIIFGVARGILLVSLLILIAALSNLPDTKEWKDSVLIPKFKPIAVWLRDFFPDNLTFKWGDEPSAPKKEGKEEENKAPLSTTSEENNKLTPAATPGENKTPPSGVPGESLELKH